MATLTTQQVPKTDIQFNSNDPVQIAASLRRLVTDIQAIEAATNALIAAQSSGSGGQTFDPPYTLATLTGLGSTNKVSGLTAGLVLRAISATNAAFQKLGFGDLALSNIVTPINGQIIQFVNGYWTNVTASLGGGVVGNNLGAGSQIYAGVSGAGSVLNFRSLTSGAGVTLSVSANSIEIDLNYTTVTGLLLPFTTVAQGVVSPPGAINGFFLGDDGNWHAVASNTIPPAKASFVNAFNAPISPPTNYVDVAVPFACTIKSYTLSSEGGPGNCVLSVWKAPLAGFPPTSANDITGGNPPTLSSANIVFNNTLTGWSTACAAGDQFRIGLVSASTITAAYLTLQMQ